MAKLDADQVREVVERAMRISRFQQIELLPLAIDRWLQLDERAAAQWIEINAVTFRPGSDTFRAVLRGFAYRNIALAEEVLSRMPPGERADSLSTSITESLTRTDPKAARAQWEAMPEGKGKNQAAWQYRFTRARTRPVEQMDEVLGWDPVKYNSWRQMVFREAVRELARGGLGAAEQAMDRITVGADRAKAFDDMLEMAKPNEFARLADYYDRAIKSDPEAVAAFQGVNQIAHGMAVHSGPKAIEWVESLPPESRAQARAAVIENWGWNDPVAAMTWVNEKISDETQAGLTQNVIQMWIKRRPADAQAWVEKLPPGPVRQQVVETTASTLAATGQSEAALKWLGQLLPESQSKVASTAASQLAWTNPAAAARWTENIEPDENSAPLFGQIAERWAAVDFKATATWINQLPAGTPRDSAVIRYASAVAKVDPAGAAEWAMTTSDERSRSKLVSAVAVEWLRRDQTGAEKWLRASTLPQEQIRALLRTR